MKQIIANRTVRGAAIVLAATLAQVAGAADMPSNADPVAIAADAGASVVSRLVLRLRPDAQRADGQSLSAAALSALQDFLGYPLTGASVTPAGNQVLELVHPVSRDVANRLVNALRLRGDVVWAEIPRGTEASAAPRPAVAARAGAANIRRLIVTFADAQSVQASRRNEKPRGDRDAMLTDAAAMPLRVSKAAAGGSWLVEFPAAVDAATAEAAADRLVSSGVARVAVPDYRMRTMLKPNDPYYSQGDQWNLQDAASTGLAGIDATHAWNITTGSPNMVIAVVDTGIVAHPDLAGRMLPGYDFVSDTATSNDGDGRDPDPTDPGDWTTTNECGAGEKATDSDWHGTLVAGILAADTSNGTGMAGLDWNARIVPVRALGRCGGDFSDILNAMTWAAGLPVPGAPANPYPAKVINLSVGGEGSCTGQMQALLDQILDAGVFIAVAAGNENRNASGYVPASCSGISTVAATDYLGERASYSNYSTYMDIAAPGGDKDRHGSADTIISTWNSGTTVAKDPVYAISDGTSFSTPEVAGVASLMLAVNPGLSPAQIKALMSQSATPFAVGSTCATQNNCGDGILNAYGAVKAAQASLGVPAAVPVVEYYHQAFNHYFMTASASDIAALDAGLFSGWQRTGYTFNAYLSATPGFGPVCRFYIPPAWGDSHFYSALQSDCQIVQATWPYFELESSNVFYIGVPDATGACPANTVPVYRTWNQLPATNHRYMTSLAVRATMVAAGWVADGGYGPNHVNMCAPQ
ncbi:MAG TPA: S8 family peptidase [Casimicrobiaceae bacterium]|nr:S8 family peptidase [Casimicrobiaceae bacterium]